jgi:hypothetical protein
MDAQELIPQEEQLTPSGMRGSHAAVPESAGVIHPQPRSLTLRTSGHC